MIEQIITEATLKGSILAPLVLGLTEVVKRFGVPKRYWAGCAVLLGIIITRFIPNEPILTGIAAGLLAIGLFSGVKNTAGK